MPDPADHYAVLGVSPDCEDVVIQGAYRALMRKYHPDIYKGADAEARAKEVNAAYEVLQDPDKRKAYDAQRAARQRVTPDRPAGSSKGERAAGGSEAPRARDKATSAASSEIRKGLRSLLVTGVAAAAAVGLALASRSIPLPVANRPAGAPANPGVPASAVSIEPEGPPEVRVPADSSPADPSSAEASPTKDDVTAKPDETPAAPQALPPAAGAASDAGPHSTEFSKLYETAMTAEHSGDCDTGARKIREFNALLAQHGARNWNAADLSAEEARIKAWMVDMVAADRGCVAATSAHG